MAFSFLNPINNKVLEQIENLPSGALGNTILKHTKGAFPDLDNVKIAIVGVLDVRGIEKKNENYTINYIRLAFYKLFTGNWDVEIADLGDVLAGENSSDTYYLLHNITSKLLNKKIIPVVIGGSVDHVYSIYRAFDAVKSMISYVAVGPTFNISIDNKTAAASYLKRMIVDEPNNLFNYANIGYQTYFNSPEEINFIDSLSFESFRLGEIMSNIHLTEPIIRGADLVTIDMMAVKSSSSGNFTEFVPNGFDGKDVCAIARYAGISESVSCFGVFNQYGTKNEAELIAQIVWYFVEGFQYRVDEKVTINDKNFKKFIVPLNEAELVFYNSILTNRWWIEMSSDSIKGAIKVIIPCSFEDYSNAVNGEIPERWWKLFKKNIN